MSVAAVPFGIILGVRYKSSQEAEQQLQSVRRQHEEFARKKDEFEAKSRRLQRPQVPPFESYYAYELEVEKLLDVNRELFVKRDELLRRGSELLRDDPAFAVYIEKSAKLKQVDDETFAAVREQIRLAKVLMTLPPPQRLAFYRTNIEPLNRRVQQLGRDAKLIVAPSR